MVLAQGLRRNKYSPEILRYTMLLLIFRYKPLFVTEHSVFENFTVFFVDHLLSLLHCYVYKTKQNTFL